MPLKFPEFTDPYCLAFFSCGSLDTDDQSALDAIDEMKDETLIASYRVGTTNAFIRVILGGSNPKHLHFDVLRKESFKDKPPEATRKRKDLEEILDIFVGKKISAGVFGRFALPVDKLPEAGLIRQTFFGTKQGNLEIDVSGAEFTIKGAPIRGLKWEIGKKGTSVGVDIEARDDTVIGKDYLNDQLQLLNSGFRLFVLGESPDATH